MRSDLRTMTNMEIVLIKQQSLFTIDPPHGSTTQIASNEHSPLGFPRDISFPTECYVAVVVEPVFRHARPESLDAADVIASTQM